MGISLEFTPNPNSLKYVVEKTLVPNGVFAFQKIEEAQNRSKLAENLLSAEGIESILIGKNFVTVTKQEQSEWDKVHAAAEKLILSHLEGSEDAVSSQYMAELAQKVKENNQGADELTTKIIGVIDTEIRPAVAADGGDIQFLRFEEGTVYLSMQGSCAGCPSSTVTLKMGIETRLKELFPEVQAVESEI